MKKFFTSIAALTLSVGLWAINNVPYIDANGQEQKANNVTGVINSTDTLKNGWYVVMPTGSEKQTGTLVCQGEVHLIVYDGAKLTATGADGKPGIEVSGEGNSLTIYGYTYQSGQLIAIGGANAAGIGGGNAAAGSNITICGGIVTANGGEYAAGIGGGADASGSNITIINGNVTANGGEKASAIGSGDSGDAASNILVATSLIVKADGNNPPSTVITNTGADLASLLTGQRYATVEKGTTNDVKAMIDAIGTVVFTDNCYNLIKSARAAYNALTDDQKASISTELAKLTNAEAAYAKLAADHAAADSAVAKINAIGTVVFTDNCDNLIKSARAAYDALTADQKALVSAEQLEILTDAEDEYAKLEADTPNTLTAGYYEITATITANEGVEVPSEMQKYLGGYTAQGELTGDSLELVISTFEEGFILNGFSVKGDAVILNDEAEVVFNGKHFQLADAAGNTNGALAITKTGENEYALADGTIVYMGNVVGTVTGITFKMIEDPTTGINSVDTKAVKSGKFLENGKLVIIKNGVKYGVTGQVM